MQGCEGEKREGQKCTIKDVKDEEKGERNQVVQGSSRARMW